MGHRSLRSPLRETICGRGHREYPTGGSKIRIHSLKGNGVVDAILSCFDVKNRKMRSARSPYWNINPSVDAAMRPAQPAKGHGSLRSPLRQDHLPYHESVLNLGVREMAALVRRGDISSQELVAAHIEQIERVQPDINAVTTPLSEAAMKEARRADERLRAGADCGPLHGVPFSVKDSIDVEGVRSTAGTSGFQDAAPAARDATLVARLRAAGGIPIAKTNLPDLLFSFETDNLIFGRTNNPYDLSRTAGGSSGGEAALIASCGSPLGLGSDCLGSVRVPAAFCGIAAIKPTSGRLPRTGHVPPVGGWVEKLWQIGPMARRVDDLILSMQLLAYPDGVEWTSPGVPLTGSAVEPKDLKIAFFTDNGIRASTPAVREAIEQCAGLLRRQGLILEERTPPDVGECYELELAILGADGCEGIDGYLRDIGSERVHPLTANFLDRMRPYRSSAAEFAQLWARWDSYIARTLRFFEEYDVVLCPVYPDVALEHGQSARDENFAGFSYTMAWSVAGFPAATVRCGESGGLPINVQVVAKPWADLTALEICRRIEAESGGWKMPVRFSSGLFRECVPSSDPVRTR